MLFVLFQIQDDLSLCPDPGILFVCLCFHLTWLQLLFAIIIILDLHFVSDRTCCMLWTGNIQNRYIRLHQVCMCNFNSKPDFVWVYNLLILPSSVSVTEPFTCYQAISSTGTCVNETGYTFSASDCCNDLGAGAYMQNNGSCVLCPQSKL